jgi:hypothetical protein
MWSVFRFSLAGGGARAYRDALAILRGAGFERASPAELDQDAPFPAAVVADVPRSPDDVTRVIFAALSEAGLRPVGVSGCRMPPRPPVDVGART